MKINNLYNGIRLQLRELINPILAPSRVKRANIITSFSIISNNCWAGHVYRYFGLSYLTPTIGLYFFAPDYLKFVKDLKRYIDMDLTFIDWRQSKYKEEIIKRHQESIPIGLLGDVEIMFLHYKTAEEAKEKWTRRKKRINWNNLYFKMSEMNLCTPGLLKEFDALPCSNKLIFVTRDYGLNSQVIFKDYVGMKEVANDTSNFIKYIDISTWLRKNN